MRSAYFRERWTRRLVSALDARVASGGRLTVGLWRPDGRRLGGDMELRPRTAPRTAGWFDLPSRADEALEREPETLRALATRLPDGSTLVVADERRRSDEILRRVMTAFAWALGERSRSGRPAGFGLARNSFTASTSCAAPRRGSWRATGSRRIPLISVDDDLSALARTFNRLFDRVETLLWRTSTSASTSLMICETPFARSAPPRSGEIGQRRTSRGRRSH